MTVQTISTKKLREDFSQVKTAMAKGQSLLLLYRSKPLAEIKPVRSPRLRNFTNRQLKQWVTDDQLSTAQQKRIDAIINRLP